MKTNPNKPRMWREEISRTHPTDIRDISLHMTRSPLVTDPVLTGLNTSQIAGILTDDPATRNELLASLEGRKKPD